MSARSVLFASLAGYGLAITVSVALGVLALLGRPVSLAVGLALVGGAFVVGFAAVTVLAVFGSTDPIDVDGGDR